MYTVCVKHADTFDALCALWPAEHHALCNHENGRVLQEAMSPEAATEAMVVVVMATTPTEATTTEATTVETAASPEAIMAMVVMEAMLSAVGVFMAYCIS